MLSIRRASHNTFFVLFGGTVEARELCICEPQHSHTMRNNRYGFRSIRRSTPRTSKKERYVRRKIVVAVVVEAYINMTYTRITERQQRRRRRRTQRDNTMLHNISQSIKHSLKHMHSTPYAVHFRLERERANVRSIDLYKQKEQMVYIHNMYTMPPYINIHYVLPLPYTQLL